jgi:histone arginine demethylase JMJD6
LIRKESQLPVLSSQSKMRWRILQAKLLQPPKSTALRIAEQDAVDLSYYPWFERKNIPVILEDFTKSWKTMYTCTFDRLVDDFGEFQWRFSDTHGATMSLNTYKKYVTSIEGQSYDAPLAVYNSQLHTDERSCLFKDYTVPKNFNAPDLFESMMGGDDDDDDDDDDDENNNTERPPYRWILIGPSRSGTGLHIDPLGTHAWVTLIERAKRWVLFPYGTDKSTIGMQDPQITSAIWFSSDWYERSMELISGAIEILQRPGDVSLPSNKFVSNCCLQSINIRFDALICTNCIFTSF